MRAGRPQRRARNFANYAPRWEVGALTHSHCPSTSCTTRAWRSWTSVHTSDPRRQGSCKDFVIALQPSLCEGRALRAGWEVGTRDRSTVREPNGERMDALRTWETQEVNQI